MRRPNILFFNIAIIKPNRRTIVTQQIKATDRAWRTAIFGLGGSKRRIGGAQLGPVLNQPLAVIGELPEEVRAGAPVWTIRTDRGLFGFAGPCAVFNDAGFGPASIGLTRDNLLSIVEFDPDPAALAEGLKNTLASRSQK
jgi:hypothetical protein